MRRVTLTLRHGGSRRMLALLAALLRPVPDGVVLIKHRHNTASTAVREGLAAAGLRHPIASHDCPRMNHLSVAANNRLKAGPRLTSRAFGRAARLPSMQHCANRSRTA